MIAIITLLLRLGSVYDAEAVRTTAVQYLTTTSAVKHLQAARVAGAKYDVDPSLLLSIAYFESRYDPTEITREPRGKTSCGVMTPVPRKGRCVPGGVRSGYDEGAEHFRYWLDSWRCRGSIRCALLGYSGGGHLIRACRGGVHVRRGKNLCSYVPGSRLDRAELIKRRLGVM